MIGLVLPRFESGGLRHISEYKRKARAVNRDRKKRTVCAVSQTLKKRRSLAASRDLKWRTSICRILNGF